MKKILKSCLLVIVAVCVGFSFVGCKKKASETTVNVENVKVINGINTNGGMTVVYGEYLYFVNGTKDNDGTSLTKNTRSAICRVKYNTETGETSGDKEVVVSDLVGFEDGSINIFGDYLYYAAPCADKNNKAEVLYNKTCFKRYDLVNKKSYTLYTTAQNDSSETIEYAYYVVGDSLNLIVYESESETITSLKIDSKVSTNYVIKDVAGCLFSENYGKVTTTGASVDANSFVYYTKAAEEGDAVQTGNKVYKVSPNSNNSCLISSGKSMTLLSIRAGKLLYSYDSAVYSQIITNSTTEKLATTNSNCISRAELSSAIYLENYKLTGKDATAKLEKSEGDITVLYFDETSKTIAVFWWKGTITNDVSQILNHTTITTISSSTSFEFIGLTNIQEVTTEDDESTTDVNEEVKTTYLCAIYQESSLIYKLKIAEVIDENSMKIMQGAGEGAIKISTTEVAETTGVLVPELIGNYVFFLAEDSNEKEYVYKADLSENETSTEEATKFSIDE